MVYIALAAMAGAVTSLSFMPWKRMSWPEIALTLFAGSTFSVFLVPWLAADWAHMDITNLRAICGVVYAGGLSSHAIMPLVIRKAKSLFGAEEKA